MSDDKQSAKGSEGSQPAAAEEKKSSWLSKLIGYGIAIGIGVVIVNMQADKKKEWFEEQHQGAIRWCRADSHCRQVVEAHWEHCLTDNYESHRRGKYNRVYTLDAEGFRVCLAQSGADTLAAR
jgi:hypothetical protein